MFIPWDLMESRVQRHGSDSDSALFTELLYAGEFILKTTVAAFVAAVQDDREKHRYRIVHDLIRADGIGEWSKTLDDLLSGPTSQHLEPSFLAQRQNFTERLPKGVWQHDTVALLHEIVRQLNPHSQSLAQRVALRTWFQLFVELRNKTRGHGAITPASCAKLVKPLKDSIDLLRDNNPLFKMPWAFLRRNLTGKYRVVDLTELKAFEELKRSAAAAGTHYQDGVYISAGGYRLVELIHSDLDVSDFYFPNGAFRNDTYELHSLITDSRLKGDAAPYLAPAGTRPPSETEGKGQLDIIGKVFSNLPSLNIKYVKRPTLEDEILAVLQNDRHPIVTLVGRGGIGKTSLALTVLREIANSERFELIIWFSSRDIDLTLAGAKQVKPQVLTIEEIADQYFSLVGAPFGDRPQNSASQMAQQLHNSSVSGPTLFVFDNFETARSPIDLFNWIDTNIRLPNKAMITSRFRDFKADYPVEVSGMERKEAEELIAQTSVVLNIEGKIDQKARDQIIEECDSHPYVMKIILGEIADRGSFAKPSALISRKDELLDALFERTYANLSPMASRIFLTLSGWRSLVPQLAVEAMLLRHEGAEGDPKSGIDSLIRTSLVERISAADGSDFLEVPLTAALFGKRKLHVHALQTIIEGDIRFLQDIGPTISSGLRDGIGPRVETFFRRTARKISEKRKGLDQIRPVLEFLARGYPPAWLLLAEIEQEFSGPAGVERAAECLRQYLETNPPVMEAATAWQLLLHLYRAAGNVIGGVDAFLRAAEVNAPTLNDISFMANWLNNSAEAKAELDVDDRKPLFKPLARLMEGHFQQCSATDLSRLAWLHLHAGDVGRAFTVAQIGAQKDPNNIYCIRLVERPEDQGKLL